MTDQPGPFGITVEQRDGTWFVYLPHQCESWDIAGDDWTGVDHATAVAELERFVAEAQTKLDALRAAGGEPAP